MEAPKIAPTPRSADVIDEKLIMLACYVNTFL